MSNPALLAMVVIALSAGVSCEHAERAAAPDSAAPDGPADAAAIRRHIVGHTVTGKMASADYAEFYAPDGSVRGAGYRARWFIRDDRFCLNYDEAPQADCYRVRIDGDEIEWRMNGKRHGTGTVVAGNPQHF